MSKIQFKIILLILVLSVMGVSCVNKKSVEKIHPIRVSWSGSQQELFAYVLRPISGDRCEVAVVVGNEVFGGPIVNRPVREMLSLAQTAQKQVAALPPPELDSGEIHKVMVSYSVTDRESFFIQGRVPDLLRTVHAAPALEELLMVMSRDQPKGYRMLDDPRVGGQFMKPPNAENR
jgi:hypothetical protein